MLVRFIFSIVIRKRNKKNFFSILKTAPKVELDKDFLNFGLCYMGDRCAQTFQLNNYLPINISFQVNELNSFFNFSLNANYSL